MTLSSFLDLKSIDVKCMAEPWKETSVGNTGVSCSTMLWSHAEKTACLVLFADLHSGIIPALSLRCSDFSNHFKDCLTKHWHSTQ